MFERIRVPTPFQVGAVNCYLAGRTVVDPGPDSEEAWTAVVDGLEANGLAPTDVERVLVTHPHPDHFGAAHRLQEAGAKVLASDPAAGIIEDFGGRLVDEQAFFVDFLERHGVAAETATTVTELPAVFVEYAPDVRTDRTLAEGDVVTVDGVDLSARSVRGHADGELVFEFDPPAADGTHAVVGDHVLADITPNPFLQPPDSDGERPRMVVEFNRSLRRLRDREYARFLPGHRDAIEDPVGRIDDILTAHEDRTEEVATIVDGPTTAVEVSEALFGDLPATELYSGMSEAIGHLDVLEDRGRVTRTECEGTMVYEPAEGT